MMFYVRIYMICIYIFTCYLLGHCSVVDLDERNKCHDEFQICLRASWIETHGAPGSAERPSARGRAQFICMNS